MTKILLTGASGFVGTTLHKKLLDLGCSVIPVARKKSSDENELVVNIGPCTNWLSILNENVDVVIHLAARVHVMHDNSINPLHEFRKSNTESTINLARQAAKLGVKRFIYLSSIKVNGESTQLGMPFTENEKFIPTDSYALSKYEAEKGLLKIAHETQMEVVIIRPPLVYGPGVRANFLSMMKWLCSGIPLPFGAIHNKRSLVALDNLIDLIITCMEHHAAVNQIFLVSDGDDLSTTELLNRVAISLGKKTKLLSVNQEIIEIGLKLIGKKDLSQRLCGSLQVDISKAHKLLNWSPPVSVEDGLLITAKKFMEKCT